MQCCTCSKWVHLRYSLIFLSKYRTLDSSHSWSCPLLCPPTRNTVTSSSDSSDMYTSTVQSSPSSANAALPFHPRLQTSYPPSAHSVSSPSAPLPPSPAPGCPSTTPASFPPPTLSGFSNGMLEVFEPEALNYFTFFCTILLTLSVSRNPILTHLPLSGFLDFCALIAPTPGLAFSLLMPHTLAEVSSFSSGRAYLSLNFLPLFSLDPYSDYVGVNISLNNSSSLSCLNVYAPLIASLRRIGRLLFSLHSSLQKSFHSGGLQLPSPPLGLKRYFRPPRGGSIRLGHLF